MKTAAVRPFIRTLFIKFKHTVFYDSNPSGPLIIFQFRRDIRSQSCLCRTLRVKQFFLVNQHTYYTVPQIFSFMIDVFTPNRISPDCPFKSNQRHMKILIFDSAVCSLSLWCDAHRRDWLPGVMHTRVEWFLKNFFCTFHVVVDCFGTSNPKFYFNLLLFHPAHGKTRPQKTPKIPKKPKISKKKFFLHF